MQPDSCNTNSQSLLCHHVLTPQRSVRAIFYFEDDGAGFEDFDGVPLTGGDVDPEVVAGGA